MLETPASVPMVDLTVRVKLAEGVPWSHLALNIEWNPLFPGMLRQVL